MKLHINWQTLGALVVSWLLSGQLATLTPDKYKPIAQLIPAIIPALFPKLVSNTGNPGKIDNPI